MSQKTYKETKLPRRLTFTNVEAFGARLGQTTFLWAKPWLVSVDEDMCWGSLNIPNRNRRFGLYYEQGAGRFVREDLLSISHEIIYKYIRADKAT